MTDDQKRVNKIVTDELALRTPTAEAEEAKIRLLTQLTHNIFYKEQYEKIIKYVNNLDKPETDLEQENKRLKIVIETAISQHHRVRPNIVVDILIREYQALTGGEK